MIYQVKDNQKIPLGTQFDNSWEIEYNRDLSSQLIDKSEWTAPEDCWFQWQYVWVGPNSDASKISQLNELKVTVNGVPVQIRGGVTSRGELEVSSITYSVNVLLKKGDVITITCLYADGNRFKDTSVRCFPIHRILSKDDGPKIWNLSSNMSVDKELRITLNTKNYAPIFVSTHSDAIGYINTQPAPCVVFVSYADEIKTIPESVRTSFTIKNNNVLTLSLPRNAEYPTWQKRVSVSEVIPGTIKSVEIVEA